MVAGQVGWRQVRYRRRRWWFINYLLANSSRSLINHTLYGSNITYTNDGCTWFSLIIDVFVCWSLYVCIYCIYCIYLFIYFFLLFLQSHRQQVVCSKNNPYYRFKLQFLVDQCQMCVCIVWIRSLFVFLFVVFYFVYFLFSICLYFRANSIFKIM